MRKGLLTEILCCGCKGCIMNRFGGEFQTVSLCESLKRIIRLYMLRPGKQDWEPYIHD